MTKLDRNGKILVSIGIIVISIGISMLGLAIAVPSIPLWGILVYIVLPMGAGTGIVLLPIIKKNRNSILDLEQRKNNQESESIKNLTDRDRQTSASDTKSSRPCKVCNTNIPFDEKICPSCGDIYS